MSFASKIRPPVDPEYPVDADDPFVFARRLKTPIWVFDVDRSRMIYANAAACALWQADDEPALCARDLSSDMSSTVAKRLRQYQADFVQRDALFNEMWTLYPNGTPVSVMVIFSGFRLPDGRMAMQCEAVGSADNEPENMRSAEALLHTDVMITLFKVGGPALYMNPAARNAAAAPDQSFADMFVDPRDHDLLAFELDRYGEHRMVSEVRGASGTRWYDLTAKTCSDAVTGEPAILVTASDVSELKIARERAKYLADRDQLTGCFNRFFLQHHFSVQARQGATRCTLLYVDVDRFKLINDRFGHETGDAVLKEIAHRAQCAVRKGDIVVRLGGDEFVIFLKDTPTEDELVPSIDRLLSSLSIPVVQDATHVGVSVSIGVTQFVPRAAQFTDILREADIALYASKQKGGNCMTFFSEELGAIARERSLIETELKRAIENREFILHFQPRVDQRTGRVVSAEALVRWQHPERGLIMPDKFIPVCEETGLIEDVGRQVLEMGCEQAIAWHRSGLDIELSLNISPRQFNDRKLLKSLVEFSRTPGFPHGKVELEITENVLAGNHDLIATKLETINNLGYRIAIDDFGTGYSNLSSISRFPLKCLKIDRSFVSQLPRSGPIIRLILTLAQQIGATTVAEGVETEAELNWLAEQNCDQIQGYFFSRPVAIESFAEIVEALNRRSRTG